MTTAQQSSCPTADREPDVQARLDAIVDLVEAMSLAERATALEVFASVMGVIGLHGHDDGIAGAQVLSQCVDLVLIAGREERRAEKEAS